MKKKNIAITALAGGVLLVLGIIGLLNVKTEEFKVTFDANGGSTVTEQVVKESKKAQMPKVPVKEGYTFDGWYLNNVLYDFNTKVKGNITLTAKWKETSPVVEEIEKVIISFNTDGGNRILDLEIEKGKAVAKPTDPTKTGYTFIAWQLDGKDYDFTKVVDANITLKATWKKVEATQPIVDEPSTTNIAVTKVTLSKTTLALKVRETSTLTATVEPTNATTKTVTWSSNNPAVATVNSSGKVTAVSQGTATITAKSGTKSATCAVTVTKVVTYSIYWEDIQDSSMGQERLYIKSSEGNYVAGTVRIVSTSGKSGTYDVPASGKVLVRSAVSSATVESVD